ncbi:hypothetical protein C9890_0480 [Perkinsus sp. BL_2016]|nr:hypothetical protein C9890_0480 [Perkinsus sp. BL_2016]
MTGSVVVHQTGGGDFVITSVGVPEEREDFIGTGDILVRSAKGSFNAKTTLGERLAAVEFIHFRIMQLLTQCLSSMMYVVLILNETRLPVIRRWLSQMVVMGAFMIQFQAWRRRKVGMGFVQFIKGRLTVIGFYVFLACYAGYVIVTINYFVGEAIPLVLGATCAWTAFFLGLSDVFIQIDQFRLPLSH